MRADLMNQYINKQVNVFTKSGSSLCGNLKVTYTGDGIATWYVDDRWSSKHYFDLSSVEHFWSDEDKPIEK